MSPSSSNSVPVHYAVAPYAETASNSFPGLRSFDDPNFKAYNPVAVESAWYDWWQEAGFFKPEFTKDGNIKDAGSFVIVHPPPNVTGDLVLLIPPSVMTGY